MSELSDTDESTFRLATGEELVFPGDQNADDSSRGLWSPGSRPTRPVRPSLRDRRAVRRLRARKVRRLVRHIEPWSVLKISLIFYFCLWIITLIAGVILWNMAVSSGTIDNVENFIEELFALDSFEFNGDQIFRATAVGGLVLVVAGAGFTVLMAVLFNLISDITGGMRITVVEEETARPRPRRTRPRRGVRPTAASELMPALPPDGMTRVPERAVEIEAGEAPEPVPSRSPARKSRTKIATASMLRQLKSTLDPRPAPDGGSDGRDDDADRPGSRDDADRPGSRHDDEDRPGSRDDDADRPGSRDDADRPGSRHDDEAEHGQRGSGERDDGSEPGSKGGSGPQDGAQTEVAAAPPDR